MGAAAAGFGASAPAAASARRDDPTITINAAGTRTGATGNPSGLAGVTFTATGNTDATNTGTCTTDSAGTCTIDITTATVTQTYTITSTAPGGWFSNPVLGIGAPPLAVTNTGTTYGTITTTSLTPTGSTTVPVFLNTSSTMSRGSQLAFSRVDPREPTSCGLKVALLFDLSTSIVSPTNHLAQYLDAGKDFVTALEGTPSEIAVYTFGTNAPATSAPGTTNNDRLLLTPVSTAAGADTVRDKIGGLTVQGAQYTNTDAGLWQIVASGERYDAVIVLTDGDPTRFGRPTATTLPSGTGVATRFIDVENAIFSANAVKAMSGVSLTHTALLAVGINIPSPGSAANIRAITADGDFSITDFAGLKDVLDGLARDQCLGSISVVKNVIPHGGTVDQAVSGGSGWEFTSTAPAETKVTDDTGAVSFETGVSTTPTTITETPRTGYTSLPQHTRCVDTITGDTVPITDVAARTFTVTPDPDGIISCYVYNEAPAPAIEIVKSAFPTEFGEPGVPIAYTYIVTNTGQTDLHDINVVDDRLGPITCPRNQLAPGEDMECKAVHITTEDDLEAGGIHNVVAVTGRSPENEEVSDTDEDTVTAIHRPDIEIQKTAFPTEYAVPGEQITYSYLVVNTGNVTLHDVTVTDSRLGPVSCPHTTLAAGASMTCHATHVTTAADVDAGHIANAATATGHPPTGPPVTDTDTDTVHAIHRPAIEIQKIASPATFSAVGQAIAFTYTVVNTGNKTLNRVTVTDSKVGRVSCPSSTLAPGEAMTCHATYTITAADLAAGRAVNVVTAIGHPPTGPAVSDRDMAFLPGPPIVPVTG
jgi:hypothetical protein